MLKATRVDGVYSADPEKDPNAKFYKNIAFEEAISKNLRIMDGTALTLACLLYTSPSPRDLSTSRMPSSA